MVTWCFGCWACNYTTGIFSRKGLAEAHIKGHTQDMCQEVRRLFTTGLFSEQTRKFKFTGKPWRFWYNEGGRLIYIFYGEEAMYPMSAIPLEGDATVENAQTTAKLWVIQHAQGYTIEEAARYRQTRRALSAVAQPAVLIPKGYSGPLCASCSKPDEGDFMPSTKDMTKQVCMVCFIKGA